MASRNTPPQPSSPQSPRLLDQVRDACRVRHFSPRTAEAYVHWIRRFIVFHHKQHPANLGPPEVAAFLTSLATRRHVSASTQNQALSALLFLYRAVLQRDLAPLPQVVRATVPVRLPVVLSRVEVKTLLAALDGPPRLVASLLYGSGLRFLECLELRIKDIDFDQHLIAVRQGKGRKDRRTMLPASLRQPLLDHLRNVRTTHDADLKAGFGRVRLPDALRAKYPNADRSWSWQFVFPAVRICHDPRWGNPTRFTSTSQSFKKQWQMPWGARASRNQPALTHCDTRSPLTSLRMATISAQSRNCLATPT